MNPITIETDVPLQLLVSDVVLKIPPRTRIVVGETIQIKKKIPNRKRQESSLAPQPNLMEDQVYENLDNQRSNDRDNRSYFSLDTLHLSPKEENACKEPLLWNNIQLKPDVYTGQLTPMPSQWIQEDHNWFIPLPPLDLHLYTGTDDDFVIPNEDLTPSSKQIIDEIRDMNAWNNESTFSDNNDEIQIALENDQTDSDDDECIQIDQLDLEQESLSNERSDSIDTAEVLSEFDVCDKV